MTLCEIRDYFIENSAYDGVVSVGKIDINKDSAVCFYESKSPPEKITNPGGKANRSYTIKSVTILLRHGTNAVKAEQKAQEIYDFFDETTFTLNGKRVFVISRYSAPIPLGTDERGVYEYSFDFYFYETR